MAGVRMSSTLIQRTPQRPGSPAIPLPAVPGAGDSDIQRIRRSLFDVIPSSYGYVRDYAAASRP